MTISWTSSQVKEKYSLWELNGKIVIAKSEKITWGEVKRVQISARHLSPAGSSCLGSFWLVPSSPLLQAKFIQSFLGILAKWNQPDRVDQTREQIVGCVLLINAEIYSGLPNWMSERCSLMRTNVNCFTGCFKVWRSHPGHRWAPFQWTHMLISLKGNAKVKRNKAL